MVESLDAYRAWLQDSIAPVVRGWCPDVVERRYRLAAGDLVTRTSDDAARRYAQACPVAGVAPTFYRLRELALPCGASLLAGIHFRGLSTEYPFVGVFAQSRWLTTREVAAAHEALLSEFSIFAPRATWWWLPAGKGLPALPRITPDQHLVMGSLEEICKAPSPRLPWVVRRVSDVDEVSAAFTALYEDFHCARPDLAKAVLPSQQEALSECARADGLYGGFDGEDLVGLMAVQPDVKHGVDAWLMWDIVLARRYCGRGLAPALQRAVLDRLDTARGRFVAGTIDARNLPSLRTALRVGRQIVGTWAFIEVDR